MRALAAGPHRRRGPAFHAEPYKREPGEQRCTSMSTILLIILILFLVGALPTWGHSRNWGYAPSGGLGLVLVIVIVLLLMGRI